MQYVEIITVQPVKPNDRERLHVNCVVYDVCVSVAILIIARCVPILIERLVMGSRHKKPN